MRSQQLVIEILGSSSWILLFIIALFVDQSQLVGNVLDNNDDSEDEDDERLAANRLEK